MGFSLAPNSLKFGKYVAGGAPVAASSQSSSSGGGSGGANLDKLSKALKTITGGSGGTSGGGGGSSYGTGGGGWSPIGGSKYTVEKFPELNNVATPDPNLTKLWGKYQGALGESNPRVDELWAKYEDQLSSSNLDQLQDVMGSKIRDRYEGAKSGLTEDLARRGMIGSGVEQELRGEMSDRELKDLIASDTGLALSDQARRDQMILSGLPMAAYERNRIDQLLAQGVPLATAIHSLANSDKALGLDQWSTMLGAQLQREGFGLQRDIAAQSAQQAQQQQMISLLSTLLPLF